MTALRYSPVLILIILLAAPFALQGDGDGERGEGPRLIVVTPHNEQIRSEFLRGFQDWHLAQYGSPATVVWSTPGGTSEIRKLLISEYTAAASNGMSPGGNADLVWGGGSYEFGVMSKPIITQYEGEDVSTRILEVVNFAPEYLKSIYGNGEIAGDPLYNREGYWFGTALSSFGIVYNRDLLSDLSLPEPVEWASLGRPGYLGTLALVNPGMSGSVTTAFEALLERRGWTRGWQVLRRMAANARSFAGSSTKGPLEVADGSAAAAVCIDFYGRYEAQRTKAAAIRSGESADTPGRIGYVDPPGETKIDPDPIGMLNGAPNPELGRRFIEFVLSEQGQALWQYPIAEEGIGPRRFELRRLPIRRSMYEDHFDFFVDKVNPWVIARPVENPNRAMRSFITPVFQSMALDQPRLLTEAWKKIISHPAYPSDATGVVTADDVENAELADMIREFDAMPEVVGPDGQVYPLSDSSVLAEVKAGWLRGGWKSEGLWPLEADPTQAFRKRSREFFKAQYESILAQPIGGEGS